MKNYIIGFSAVYARHIRLLFSLAAGKESEM
jgi:hypothetical protein